MGGEEGEAGQEVDDPRPVPACLTLSGSGCLTAQQKARCAARLTWHRSLQAPCSGAASPGGGDAAAAKLNKA